MLASRTPLQTEGFMISDRDLIDHIKLSIPEKVTDEEVIHMWKVLLWGQSQEFQRAPATAEEGPAQASKSRS